MTTDHVFTRGFHRPATEYTPTFDSVRFESNADDDDSPRARKPTCPYLKHLKQSAISLDQTFPISTTSIATNNIASRGSTRK